jgi:hypothetical protein
MRSHSWQWPHYVIVTCILELAAKERTQSAERSQIGNSTVLGTKWRPVVQISESSRQHEQTPEGGSRQQQPTQARGGAGVGWPLPALFFFCKKTMFMVADRGT